MVINWYGEGCFKIQVGGVTLLTDPFSNETGLTPPRFKADITLRTLTPYPFPYEETNSSLISGPGEYDIKGIDISGYPMRVAKAKKDEGGKAIKTVYAVATEDLRLGFLGHLGETPDPSLIEELGDIDLLFIPAGGAPFISQEEAAKLIKQISPKIVVASFFKIPGLKSKVEDARAFLKELGQKTEPQEKLTVKKKDLPAAMQVVVLTV